MINYICCLNVEIAHHADEAAIDGLKIIPGQQHILKRTPLTHKCLFHERRILRLRFLDSKLPPGTKSKYVTVIKDPAPYEPPAGHDADKKRR